MRRATKVGSGIASTSATGIVGSLVLALVISAGCDSGNKDAAEAKAKKAAEAEAEAEAKKAAERKAEREAAQKAEQEAAARLAAQIDALAVIPEQLPKTLDAACKQMLDAYDGFMRRTLEGDMLTKWETGGNEMQLAVFRKECQKRDIATAACQAHALAEAPKELEPSLADIMAACADKAAAADGQ